MDQRLPFYMVYGTDMPVDMNMWSEENISRRDTWSEENISRRDYEYMKSAYPDQAKRILPYVEEECDRLEYSGSMMFDEYPDQLQLRLLCRRIYNKVQEKETMNGNKKPGIWLFDLIQVMTYHEILRRRSECRRYKRKFY